jgi:hypothetical protein
VAFFAALATTASASIAASSTLALVCFTSIFTYEVETSQQRLEDKCQQEYNEI